MKRASLRQQLSNDGDVLSGVLHWLWSGKWQWHIRATCVGPIIPNEGSLSKTVTRVPILYNLTMTIHLQHYFTTLSYHNFHSLPTIGNASFLRYPSLLASSHTNNSNYYTHTHPFSFLTFFFSMGLINNHTFKFIIFFLCVII